MAGRGGARIGASIVLALVLVVLGVLAQSPGRASGARADSSPASAEHGATLYNAAFGKKGLKGWTVFGPAWQVNKKGIVTYDRAGKGQVASLLLAPFSTQGLHDFSVQASIAVVGTHQYAINYGLVVRAQGPRGVYASVGEGVSPYDLDVDGPFLIWDTDSIAGAAVTLPPGYNRFRVDVHGTDFTLSVNGHRLVQFTIPTYGDSSTHVRVGVSAWASRVIYVKSFVVTRLAAAPPLPAAPPLKKVNLGVADGTAALPYLDGTYVTPGERAYLTSTSVRTVRASGFRLGYGVSFELDSPSNSPPTSGPYRVFSTVDAYRSSHMSAAALTKDLAAVKQRWAGSSTSSGDLTGLGDEAHDVVATYSEPNYSAQFPAREVTILYRRGPYEVRLIEDGVRAGTSRDDAISAATALATIIDQRIQAQAPSSTPATRS
jgi:hypothetical protein